MNRRTRTIRGAINLAKVPSIRDLTRAEVLEDLGLRQPADDLPTGMDDHLYEVGKDLERERQTAQPQTTDGPQLTEERPKVVEEYVPDEDEPCLTTATPEVSP